MGDMKSVTSDIKYSGLVQEAVFQTSSHKPVRLFADGKTEAKEHGMICPRVQLGGGRAKVRPLAVRHWVWWPWHDATLCLFSQWC